MKNPGVYIGVTVLSDGKDGGKMVASFTGQSYPQGMDDLEVAPSELRARPGTAGRADRHGEALG